MCARIVCTPRDKDGNIRGYSAKNEKPPSLAGVEKFIRAKIAAAAALAVPSASALPPKATPPGAPPPLAATTAEVGGAASKTNPAPVNGVPTAETVQAPFASPSPQVPLQQEADETKQTAPQVPSPQEAEETNQTATQVPPQREAEETNQTATDAPQLPPDDTVAAASVVKC
jgi:hypothetical protein